MNLSHYVCNVIDAEYMDHINDGIEVNIIYVHE